MSLNEVIKNQEVIFVGPKELKDYFFVSKKEDPFLNFKYFTLDELVKNINGNYLDKNVLKLALHYFEEYSFSLVKEVSKFCFYSLDINKCENSKIINFCKLIEEKGYKKVNNDFIELLKLRKVIFINLSPSSYVKNLIKSLNLKNYEFKEIDDFVEMNNEHSYHEFFNIGEEIKYSLNTVLSKVYEGKNLSDYEIILDTSRYDYYLKLFLTNLKVPVNLNINKTYKDSQIFKSLYQLIDDNFLVLNYLNENKEKFDESEFKDIFNLLSFYEIDSLKNKKINFKEILSNQVLPSEQFVNALNFNNSLSFSKNKELYVLGLDNTFLPKVIKDNGLFSFDFLVKNGFDSLDETNLMKSKIEETFLKQKKITFISYHFKDNSGKYSKSYYLDALNYKKEENETLSKEFIEDVSKLYYRNYYDIYKRNGIQNEELAQYKKAFNGEFIKTFNPEFKRFDSYKIDQNVKYSYTNLKEIHLCPFSYFVNDVLKGNINSQNIYQKYGVLTHAILEDVYKNNFNFDKSCQKAIQRLNYFNVEIDEKEKILLKRFLFELKQTIEKIILPHKENMSFFKNYSEKSIEISEEIPLYSFSDDEFPLIKNEEIKITLKGKIDSILETKNSHLFLVDYKTGNDTFSKNNVFKYQLDLQLPTYLYLIEKTSDPDLKDKDVDGIFIERIVANDGRFYNFMFPEKEDFENLKYNGAFINQYDDIKDFDFRLSEPQSVSEFVAGLSLTSAKKPTINKKGSRASSRDDFIKMSKIVEDNLITSIQKIAFGSFHIKPFYKGKSNVACTFCNDFDICFKKDKVAEDDE